MTFCEVLHIDVPLHFFLVVLRPDFAEERAVDSLFCEFSGFVRGFVAYLDLHRFLYGEYSVVVGVSVNDGTDWLPN